MMINHITCTSKIMTDLCFTKQNHIPWSFAHKVVRIDDKFTKPIVVYRGKTAAYKFIRAILK